MQQPSGKPDVALVLACFGNKLKFYFTRFGSELFAKRCTPYSVNINEIIDPALSIYFLTLAINVLSTPKLKKRRWSMSSIYCTLFSFEGSDG